MNHRQLFLDHVAQTSPKPIGIEMSSAEGVWLTDTDGKNILTALRVLVCVI